MHFIFPPDMILLISLMRRFLNKIYSILRNICRIFYYNYWLILNFSILILISIFFDPSYVIAQNNLEIPKLSIQTQSYLHNPEEGTYLYRNAKVEWEEISVEGTEIIFHPATNEIKAKGYVRVTEGNTIAVMDELKINIIEEHVVLFLFKREICQY